jgi:predicted ABC-type ATPase
LKEYVLFAGVNGAGKSTLYNIPYFHDLKRVNTDEILVANGGGWRNMSDVYKAMRDSIKTVDKYFTENISFCHETTLSGKTIIKNIQKAKAADYKVKMYYVGLASADLAVERVKKRVEMGGHNIPEADIRRRFDVSLNNLKKAILFCDNVYVYDNTISFRPIAAFQNGNLTIRNDFGIKWFSSYIT